MNKPVHITKTGRGIDAAHRVPNHESKCYNLHGHRYELIAHAEGEIVTEPGHPAEGMLVDFGVLGHWLADLHELWDHALILYKEDPLIVTMEALAKVHGIKLIELDLVPTAENIARIAYDYVSTQAEMHFRPNNFRVTGIECWETPTSMARFPA